MRPKGIDIEAVVRRCQQGEEAAYTELFRTIQVDIRRILMGLIGPDSELDDMVQQAALEIFRSIKSFKGKSKFSTWMYRLVINVGFQCLRKRKRQDIPVDLGEMANELTSDSDDPCEYSEKQERLIIAKEILQSMNPKKRIVFLLHEVEGYTSDEIATMVSASKFTVKSRLFYARKEFAKKIRQRATIRDSVENSVIKKASGCLDES